MNQDRGVTGGDVVDEIIGAHGERPLADQAETEAAVVGWCSILERIKRENTPMAMSPAELKSARRVIRTMLNAIDLAVDRHTAPLN